MTGLLNIVNERRTRKVFTEDDLFNIYRAETIGSQGSDYQSNWCEIVNDDDLIDQYERLSESGKKKFDLDLNKIVGKYEQNFLSIPKKVNTPEQFEEHQQILQEIKENVVQDLGDYLRKA